MLIGRFTSFCRLLLVFQAGVPGDSIFDILQHTSFFGHRPLREPKFMTIEVLCGCLLQWCARFLVLKKDDNTVRVAQKSVLKLFRLRSPMACVFHCGSCKSISVRSPIWYPNCPGSLRRPPESRTLPLAAPTPGSLTRPQTGSDGLKRSLAAPDRLGQPQTVPGVFFGVQAFFFGAPGHAKKNSTRQRKVPGRFSVAMDAGRKERRGGG